MLFSRFILVLFFLFPSLLCLAQEVCNNGIDDDGDGAIDLNDTDCSSYVMPIIGNPSFEQKLSCPDGWSQLQYATGWKQHHNTAGSTDFYHLCGNCSLSKFGVSEVVPQPFPAGEGFAGFYDVKQYDAYGSYKEVLVTCLRQPLQPAVTYVLEFYIGFLKTVPNFNMISKSPASISFYGHANCNELAYGHNGQAYRGCPIKASPQWKELKQISVAGSPGQWVKVKTELTVPSSFTGMVIGPPCSENQHDGQNYYLIDNILLYRKTSYELPTINRTGDLCADTLTLTSAITPLPPAYSIQWYKDNVALVGETSQTLKLTRTRYAEGDYSVRYNINGVTYLSPPEVIRIYDYAFYLPDSVARCNGGPAKLEASLQGSKTDCSVTYRWSTGDTSKSIIVEDTGLYWFETNKNGCRLRDTIKVINRIAPVVNLGADTVLCKGQSVLLNAGNPGSYYNWQNNTGAQTQLVSAEGIYWVAVTDGYCSSNDTIRIAVDDPPYVLFGRDSVICTALEKELAPKVNGRTYVWNTGATTPTIVVSTPGMYTLLTENACGKAVESIKLTKGICEFYMPSAFTPNGDGLNDGFGLSAHAFIKQFDFKIYSRWGEVVYTSVDPGGKWDGRIKGHSGPAGVYVWVVNYTDFKGNKEFRKGTVTLIR